MPNSKRKIACALNIEALVSADCFFDALGSLVIVLDKNGKILLFNSGAEEMLGYKAENVIGKNWFELFVPEEIRDTIYKVFLDIVSGDTQFLEQYDNEILKKNGKKITVRWHTSAIRGSKNEIEGIIASAVDISKIIEIETKLGDKIAELENLNRFMVSRELKMIELKEKIKKYEEK